MKEIEIASIKFPEIKLSAREAHKMRGYFGNVFREHSPLLHNHFAEGGFRYAYPLIQYKVINQEPVLTGIGDGARLLAELFLQIKHIRIEARTYPVYDHNLSYQKITTGIDNALHAYRFSTLWMALNQQNYAEYSDKDERARKEQLTGILTANMLSFFKGIGLYLAKEDRILVSVQANEKSTQFKNQKMLAFTGSFTTNALLPDLIGLGKSVSRGFGSIQKI